MKRMCKKIALITLLALVGSVLLQLGYNMLLIKPYEPELKIGSDGK